LESQPPPGFEEAGINQGTKMQLAGNIEILAADQQPLGSGKDQDALIIDTTPPGYENEHITSINSQSEDEPKQRRVNQLKESAVRSNTKRFPQQQLSNSTTEISESLVRLAKESLHIGEILGVRVIGDEQAAISKITKPLKNRKHKGGKQH